MPLAMGWKAKDAPTPRGRLIPPVFPHLISTASSSQGSRPAPCKPSSNQPAQRDRCCWDVVPSVGVSSNTKALHEPLLGLSTKSGGREMSPMGCQQRVPAFRQVWVAGTVRGCTFGARRSAGLWCWPGASRHHGARRPLSRPVCAPQDPPWGCFSQGHSWRKVLSNFL